MPTGNLKDIIDIICLQVEEVEAAEAVVEVVVEGVVEAVEAAAEAVVEAEVEAMVEAMLEAVVEAEVEAMVEAMLEAVVEAEVEAMVEAMLESMGKAMEEAAEAEVEVEAGTMEVQACSMVFRMEAANSLVISSLKEPVHMAIIATTLTMYMEEQEQMVMTLELQEDLAK
jgi:hypothetical protein